MNTSDQYYLVYVCTKCEAKFSSDAILLQTINEDRCPSCGINALSTTYVRSGGQCKCKPFSTREIATKLKRKVTTTLWRDNHRIPTIGSLNSKPSPLDIPNWDNLERPRRRALLIGVAYKDWQFKLDGTINDVKNMRNMLILDFGFRGENILVLSDEEPETKFLPTKKNIEESFKWLVRGSERGDTLVFFFSGHGLRSPDLNGDEKDTFNETICPVDYMQDGMILDDEINSALVWPLKEGVTLHALVDACHSGTVFDLPLVYNRQKKYWEDHSPQSGARKHTNGGLAISLAACEDHQMAVDTSAFTKKEMSGAMTYIIRQILQKHRGLTYGQLLEFIYEYLANANQNGGLCRKIFGNFFHNDKLLQKPQLSASEPFDVYHKRFIL